MNNNSSSSNNNGISVTGHGMMENIEGDIIANILEFLDRETALSVMTLNRHIHSLTKGLLPWPKEIRGLRSISDAEYDPTNQKMAVLVVLDDGTELLRVYSRRRCGLTHCVPLEELPLAEDSYSVKWVDSRHLICVPSGSSDASLFDTELSHLSPNWLSFPTVHPDGSEWEVYDMQYFKSYNKTRFAVFLRWWERLDADNQQWQSTTKMAVYEINITEEEVSGQLLYQRILPAGRDMRFLKIANSHENDKITLAARMDECTVGIWTSDQNGMELDPDSHDIPQLPPNPNLVLRFEELLDGMTAHLTTTRFTITSSWDPSRTLLTFQVAAFAKPCRPYWPAGQDIGVLASQRIGVFEYTCQQLPSVAAVAAGAAQTPPTVSMEPHPSYLEKWWELDANVDVFLPDGNEPALVHYGNDNVCEIWDLLHQRRFKCSVVLGSGDDGNLDQRIQWSNKILKFDYDSLRIFTGCPQLDRNLFPLANQEDANNDG